MPILWQDAISIVRKYGKPNIFLTVTCNPAWENIVNELLPGQQTQDRPDIVARIFELTLADIENQLTKEGIFGMCDSNMRVIEPYM